MQMQKSEVKWIGDIHILCAIYGLDIIKCEPESHCTHNYPTERGKSKNFC